MSYVPESEALEHPIRALILRFIERHPGIRLTELSTCLGLENSTLLWHLRKLQAARLVHRLGTPRARVYWADRSGTQAKETARHVAALNTDRKRRVLASVLETPGLRMIEAAPRLDITPAVARQVANGLQDIGLVTRLDDPNGHQFHPTAAAQHALDAAARIQEAMDQAGKSDK